MWGVAVNTANKKNEFSQAAAHALYDLCWTVIFGLELGVRLLQVSLGFISEFPLNGMQRSPSKSNSGAFS